MQPIKDIRIYRSTIENIPGNSLPEGFYNLELCAVARRIVMKLQENGFSMGDFHHLYINLTTCREEGTFSLSQRGRDPYFPWYRYYDVGVSQAFYDSLETRECIEKVIGLVEQVLLSFATPEFDEDEIRHCIAEAVEQGEKMTMVYKEKQASKNKAVIYLRYLDNGKYFPLLKVFDLDGSIMFERDLPETNDLYDYGEIRLSSKKVTIKPRKNSYTKNQEAMSFDLL
ncbi:hypothetical protein B0O40_0994 [Ruminococcaceae bacterium R-25]|nr:hypothetical protein B0O40_0994 [Ruminococcaceae bacterium R-25]SUQ11609.1 hypothetical protein SAMN06297423_0994 [Oscillospiraceae bacterium]